MSWQGSQDYVASAELASTSAQRIRCTGAATLNDHIQAGRFVLDNGLTILLLPDMRAQVFAYQTWFRVGSKHERPDRTGMAHLFEHLMFKATKNFADGQFDHEMESRGGDTNAATWVDWTHYTAALAAQEDNLEMLVQLESDRMVNLLLDAKTFRSELDVVKNERRMAVDDSVPGCMGERLYATAFSVHPYRWPTIGSMEHLSQTTLEELRSFYRTYYAPNNATVVVVGAVDPVETLALLAKAYGVHARRDVPAHVARAEPPQTEPRVRSDVYPVVAPQVVVGFHTPAQNTAGYAALELLQEVLVGGDSARLYRALVTEQHVASHVEASLAPLAEPGLFEVFMTLRPEVGVDEAVAALQEELEKVALGLEGWEDDKARHTLELSFFEGFEDVESCAEMLGHCETNWRDFAYGFSALQRWSAVTPQALKDASRCFSVTNRTVIAALPNGEVA